MKPMVRVEAVGKQYRIGARPRRDLSHDTLRDSIMEFVRRPLHRWRQRNDADGAGTIWALRDVSFEVEPGEVIGVIGRNGAGKSTLLKVLSRITEPTTGRVELYGRAASLLEVGTGFNLELTGRENIFLNGAILGMKRSEIRRKFDDIVGFAEVERFLDTPVKHYSSGMYMRLAFAVASHLEPEILIVDEVLAVGDAGFQKRCLGRMGEVARSGRTIVFVSHNMTAVRSLCGRTMWLDGGRVVRMGETAEIVRDYSQHGSSSTLERVWRDAATAPGDRVVRLRRVAITPLGQPPGEAITVKTALRLTASCCNEVAGTVLRFRVVLSSLEGVAIFDTGFVAERVPRGPVHASFVIPGDLLNDGAYTIGLSLVRDASVAVADLHDVLTFEVHDAEREDHWYGKWTGTVRPKFDWLLRVGK
jgi:lipopolysaccharide transport system ATP-binding protein